MIIIIIHVVASRLIFWRVKAAVLALRGSLAFSYRKHRYAEESMAVFYFPFD